MNDTFEATGQVVHGQGRGKGLGCPTANLDIELPQWLPSGVYAASATLGGIHYNAVANVGIAPFYGLAQKRILEVHLIHTFPSDFYGETLVVKLVQHLRPERADFNSESELKDAIQQDIKNALVVLK